MRIVCVVVAFSIVVGAAGSAERRPNAHQSIELSPELMALLKAEMVEIAGGVQTLALSLASGDWKSIRETSERIRASYIMEKALTPDQVTELRESLPESFKELDAEFHRRAAKLGEAAEAHDDELVAFHYSRLLESCARCHVAYAGDRFPGFESPKPSAHHH